MKRACSFVVLAVFCCALSMAGAEELVDNPVYKNWSKFKPGAYVKMKSVTKVSGQETTVDMTQKLIEVTPEKVVIEVTTAFKSSEYEMPANTSSIDQMAKVDKSMLPENNPDIKVIEKADDKVEVAGKSLSAKRTKSEININNMATVTEVWECDEIPGGTAKMNASTKAADMETFSETVVTEYSAN